MPLDRMLFETDAPDLLPRGIIGPLNEPAHLPGIIEQAAQWRSESFEQLVHASSANARRLFLKKIRFHNTLDGLNFIIFLHGD